MSWRWVFITSGSLELAAATFLFCALRPSLKLTVIAWITSIFVIYRIGDFWIGGSIPCGCLGTLTGALGITYRTADVWMKLILVYLGLGSIVTVLYRIFPRTNSLTSFVGRERNGMTVLAACCIIAGGCISVRAQSTVDAFKSFLSSPPVIKRVLFDSQNLVLPPSFLPIPADARASATNVYHNEAAWQPDGNFFVRDLWDWKDLNSPLTANRPITDNITGVAGGRAWHIVTTNIYSSTRQQPDNYIAGGSSNALQLLFQNLNLGVVGMRPGTLSWDGNHFTARTWSGTEVRGELEVEAGLPSRLSVQSEDGEARYISEYQYTDAKEERLPCGVPNSVQTVSVESGKIVPYWRTVIYEIQSTAQPLPEAYFEPERFFSAATEVEEDAVTNGAVYVVRNGVVVRKVHDLQEPAFPTSMKRFLVLAVLLAVFLGFPIAYLVRWKTKVSNKRIIGSQFKP
jgi:hypothetical protein